MYSYGTVLPKEPEEAKKSAQYNTVSMKDNTVNISNSRDHCPVMLMTKQVTPPH
jgi:hypothetical protein